MPHTTSPTPCAMGPSICFTAFALYRALNATHHQVLSITKEPEEMSSIQVQVFGYLLTTVGNMKEMNYPLHIYLTYSELALEFLAVLTSEVACSLGVWAKDALYRLFDDH